MVNPAPAFLGILMLDTQFPRPVGDVGNAETFARAGIPVRYTIVRGASPQRVIKEADPTLLEPFVDAARELVAQGASMISTSCGFLAAYQSFLSEQVSVPVLTSSLLQGAWVPLPGIVTIDAASLTDAILGQAGVPPNTPVQGIEPGCEFHRRLLGNELQLDVVEAERNVVDAAMALVARHPEVRSIVFECTNMPPYRDAVIRATGRPVFDIETLLVSAWNKAIARR
ncbi:aspartate/glutamate racemase family protein [Curvibacter sp. CHRR-16]|uniref:aspartate/glutamate racemase family protein n=1 Tax=Curvibacter sp. CHRR-16 TaxID=2835872 RepID=UPI001BDA3799|nr:aspartate/glutamate racemase family protein [Curvibacter sp. CHRR-16]MBT0569770.1 aspartate/glutamate racemase family protein [Curvibacter sp. CHRR-16]